MSSSPTAAVSNRRKRWSPTSAPWAARPSPCRWIWRKPPASGLRRQPRQRAGQRLGRATFDHLINAGHGEFARWPKRAKRSSTGCLTSTLRGIFLVQTLLPLLADGGRIVNFSSGLTRVSYHGFSAYAAAKAAVEMLSVYMARELGGRASPSIPSPRRYRHRFWRWAGADDAR